MPQPAQLPCHRAVVRQGAAPPSRLGSCRPAVSPPVLHSPADPIHRSRKLWTEQTLISPLNHPGSLATAQRIRWNEGCEHSPPANSSACAASMRSSWGTAKAERNSYRYWTRFGDCRLIRSIRFGRSLGGSQGELPIPGSLHIDSNNSTGLGFDVEASWSDR